MARNYYCLVAGLPDLVMEDRKVALSSLELRDILQESLHPKDYKLLSLFFFKYDHHNIIAQLYQDSYEFDKRGVFSQALLDEVCDKKTFELSYEGAELLPFQKDFLHWFFDQENTPLRVEAERKLTADYFSTLQKESNKFVQAYTRFELNIRNLFIALNGRKHDLELEQDIVGIDEITDALKKSRARDFGLSSTIENLDTLLQIHDTPDLLDRELKLDTLRWQFYDEATFFHYFSIEKVIAFTLKLMIAERWFELDEEKGRELFKKLLRNMETGYEFPDEFRLNHGKKK